MEQCAHIAPIAFHVQRFILNFKFVKIKDENSETNYFDIPLCSFGILSLLAKPN